MNHKKILSNLYANKYKNKSNIIKFSKSHWPNCEYALKANNPIVMPENTPCQFISCNICLFNKNYMIVVKCNPYRSDWLSLNKDCQYCEDDIEHKTWLRVSGAGEYVEPILRSIWSYASHPIVYVDKMFYNDKYNHFKINTQQDLINFKISIPEYMIVIDDKLYKNSNRFHDLEFNGDKMNQKYGVFDNKSFYIALDRTRQSRNITWKDIAMQSGISASTLTRMAQGKRSDVDGLAALASWANLKIDDFIISNNNKGIAEPLALISDCLRRDLNLTSDAADSLDDIIRILYEHLRITSKIN